MKIPLHWLAEWIDLPWPAEELARRLTLSGFEVEGFEAAAPAFEEVVVGEILSLEPHPQADKLRVCRVSTGTGEPLQIVCGAANARAGLKAPLARVGATLPDGMEIKAAKLRGVDSAGMLCSAKELGLAQSSSGLLELPADAPVGKPLREVLDLDDTVLELKVYANRGDALSVRGVAREVAALTQAAPKVRPAVQVAASGPAATAARVSAAAQAPRLLTRAVRGVDNRRTTPLWMQERLRRAGLRSINPVVDVTNYVMLELGQPLHAYDLSRIQGALHVRMATVGESMQLLDGRTLTLQGDELLITDDSAAIGLAGIMGGAGTSITVDAGDLLLESAFFAPAAILGRARRHGLHTDASQRFERGVDPAGQRAAIERATQLILELCGGAAGPVQEVVSQDQLPRHTGIILRRSQLARLAGVVLDNRRVTAALEALGLAVHPTADGWKVTPPSWRFDLTIEADLIEEVLRTIGFDAVPEVPRRLPQRFAQNSGARLAERVLLDAMVARGYQESITYAFVNAGLQNKLFPSQAALQLANPIAADQGVMRVSMWPGLIGAALENRRRQQERVRLFEIGAVFLPQGATHEESLRLGAVAFGNSAPEQWGLARRDADFFDLKADAMALLEMAAPGAGFEFVAGGTDCLHPGRSARILREGQPVGLLGELHPSLARELEAPAGLLLLELDITRALRPVLPAVVPVSRFPQVRRDLAVTVPKSTPLSVVRARVNVAAGSLLRELTVFDLYQGQGIEPTRKSIALGLIFQDNNRTLKDDEADALMAAVAADLSSTLDARIRD